VPAETPGSRTTARTTLRHRRITIWLSGVPARELAERAGHARPSMSLDVYSHVMPPDEAASERFLALIDA
jgi:integrase